MSKNSENLNKAINVVNKSDKLKFLLDDRSNYVENIGHINFVFEQKTSLLIIQTSGFLFGKKIFNYTDKTINSDKLLRGRTNNISHEFSDKYESLQRVLIREHLEMERTHCEVMISFIDKEIEKILNEKSNSNSS